MPHSHDHHVSSYNKAFGIGILLNVVFVAVEVGYGIFSGSLALLADAGHNLSDVLGLVLAWGAGILSHRKPTARRTYGWKSTTIMAALTNALILMAAIGGIAWEAIRRFGDPASVAGEVVIAVAAVGVVINTVTALLFMSGGKRDLNIRGAFLHMAADAGVSAGVVIAGILILFTGLRWIDPVVSLLIAAIIFLGTWRMFKDAMNLALQAVPADIDTDRVFDYLSGLPGVTAVHDLHIWAMSTTETALTVHLVKPDSAGDDALLKQVRTELHDRFGIEHVTIQLEREDMQGACGDDCSYPTRPDGK